MDGLKNAIPKIRQYECIVYVSGYLEGELDDWPSHIQDEIYAAMERKSHEVQLPLAVVQSYCDKDLDSTDERQTWFLRVILSEVVAVDTSPQTARH